MKVLRGVGVLASAGALTLLVPSPTWALSESGFKNCSPNTVATRGVTKGWAVHYFGGVPFNKGYHSNWYTTYANEGWTYASWKVDGSVGINYVGTYAYCPG